MSKYLQTFEEVFRNIAGMWEENHQTKEVGRSEMKG
jgi:hypothetical protein